MNRKILTALVAGALSAATPFCASSALADDNRFSLSTGFDNSSSKYETGPWMFKLTAPTGPGIRSEAPRIVHPGTIGAAGSAESELGDTEAAATYNLYPGSTSTLEINLTGKITVNTNDKASIFGLSQNDYAAQMDVYQSLDKFTAMGSLGSKVMGSPTGITLNPLLYGSFGGIYQFTEQASTGVDMSLSQDPSATGIMQQEFSAFVNYRLDKDFKARGYVLRGISNGTPNNTVGGQVYYGF